MLNVTEFLQSKNNLVLVTHSIQAFEPSVASELDSQLDQKHRRQEDK